MLTFMIIMVLVAIATLVPIGIKEHKESGFPISPIFVAAMIVAVAMAVPTIALVTTVGDTSKAICSIDEYNGAHQTLYYDKAEEKYFIVEADLWDMSKIQYREYLDTALVEQYLEHKNAIEEIPLF